MLIEALVPRVRNGLGVAESYDNIEIPDLIKSAIRRLLRDFNFPKSKQRAIYDLVLDDQGFDLPVGFKLPGTLRFYNPLTKEWSEPLRRYERFTLPSKDGVTSGYWIEGQKLWIDAPIEQDGVGKQLVLFYQDQSWELNYDWITDNYEDAVAYLAIVRGAGDMRKDEVMKIYAPLWSDEQTSLAIYLNELEWDSVEILMREPSMNPRVRYPTGRTGV